MSVADQPRRNDYLGDGSTVAFAYTFRILTKQSLRTLVSGADLVVDTDYAVGGVGDSGGGTITFVTAPANGVTVTLLGDHAFDQPSIYSLNEAFPATRVEKDFDKALMRAQQLREVQTRQLTYPDNEAGSPLARTLPTVAERTNKLLGFDASGNPIGTLGPDAAATSADRAATEAAAAAAAASELTASAAVAAAVTSALSASASATAASISATTLQGTSTTSVAIATGNTVFTTQAGKQFSPGEWLLITADADPTNYLHGQVTSYSGTGLIVNVTDTGGSGTFGNWTITVSGTRGVIGVTGPTGPTGGLPIAVAGGTGDAITAVFSPPLTLTDKMMCAVVSIGANTLTNPTFAPDGLTARTIVKNGGAVLAAGEIAAAGFVSLLVYNLAGTRWELLNPNRTAGTLTAGTPLVNATLNTNTMTTQAHGLGVRPKFFNTVLTCLVTDLGYGVGDIVNLPEAFGSAIGVFGFYSMYSDATDVVLITNSASSGISIMNKSSRAETLISLTSWSLTITPYRLN